MSEHKLKHNGEGVGDTRVAQEAIIREAMAIPATAANNFLILPSIGGARLTFSESSLSQFPPVPRVAVVMPIEMLKALAEAIGNYVEQVERLPRTDPGDGVVKTQVDADADGIAHFGKTN